MKYIFFAILIIALVFLFGTWPLSILAKIFSFFTKGLEWLADFLNIFGWNGLI